ncbi:hypothetical protein JOJ88_001758 [Pantoea cypripedii]|nr:hypothetical protein [Pantoea cypripedii]
MLKRSKFDLLAFCRWATTLDLTPRYDKEEKDEQENCGIDYR